MGRPAILAGERNIVAEHTCYTVVDEIVNGCR
jgi:hypothetical protein